MQVPLGVSFFDENKIDEMCKILEELHKYIPCQEYETTTTLPDSTDLMISDVKFHNVLLGGDQLTCARIRGAQSVRANHETAADRLSGLSATVEDWHAKMTLLKVSHFTSNTYH